MTTKSRASRTTDTPEARERFRRLYMEGRSYREICDHMGWAHEQNVGHWKVKLGLPDRPRGPRQDQIDAVVAMAGRRAAHIARDLRMQPSTVVRILTERGLYDARQREEERPGMREKDLVDADARWASWAGDLRYEDAAVRPTLVSRFDQRRDTVRSEVGCAAGMCVT